MVCITSYRKNVIEQVISEALLKFHCRTPGKKETVRVSPFLEYEMLGTTQRIRVKAYYTKTSPYPSLLATPAMCIRQKSRLRTSAEEQP